MRTVIFTLVAVAAITGYAQHYGRLEFLPLLGLTAGLTFFHTFLRRQ